MWPTYYIYIYIYILAWRVSLLAAVTGFATEVASFVLDIEEMACGGLLVASDCDGVPVHSAPL